MINSLNHVSNYIKESFETCKVHLKQDNSSANQMEESCERVSRHKTPNENSLHNEFYYLIEVLPAHFTVDEELEPCVDKN